MANVFRKFRALSPSANAPSSSSTTAAPQPTPPGTSGVSGSSSSRNAKRKARKRRNRRPSFIDTAEPSEQEVQQQQQATTPRAVHPTSPTSAEVRPSLVRLNTNVSSSRLHHGSVSGSNLHAPRLRHSPSEGHQFGGLNSADPRSSFYSLGSNRLSAESLDNEALLDHRDDDAMPSANRRRSGVGIWRGAFASTGSGFTTNPPAEETPLLGRRRERERERERSPGGARGILAQAFGMRSNSRGSSVASSLRQKEREREGMLRTRTNSSMVNINGDNSWDINNPPSRPQTPVDGHRRSMALDDRGDTIIDFDGISRAFDEDALIGDATAATPGGTLPGNMKRRMTIVAAEDVCFPQDILSEIAEEEEMDHQDRIEDRLHDSYFQHSSGPDSSSGRTAAAREQQNLRERRPGSDRFGNWPDLAYLEQWAVEEKEEQAFEEAASGSLSRTRKIQEPLVVDGRLRPRKTAWHREIADQPYRFTYFNEEFDSTIHSQTISELVQPGQSFHDMFVMEPILLEDSDEEEDVGRGSSNDGTVTDRKVSENNNLLPGAKSETARSTPIPSSSPPNGEKRRRYGPQPVFWLDILSPTQAEMGVLAKTFGIHRLTVEDIMLQEAREKVELFKHYYFVNYRSFEQDRNSEEYMEPVNMSFIVFREGILSFHFSQTPHPANVRRRIRQLSDYMLPSTDWMSFAIIDDVTDAYIPLILAIEEEVDTIDSAILDMHSGSSKEDHGSGNRVNHKDMLRHVGDCRKKVMGLYRLLGNKADVIKGFAKRCNEQWTVAPKTEIGLYLGDIQDHIVTMTANLGYYENLLSRAYSNYLAQINIRMNERAERTNDVLSTLTVLGTIVLPMNIVTGLWGMNTKVPGQDGEDLWWFWTITAGLFAFGLMCFMITKRMMA